jgi:outer membrane protein TolC
VARIGVATAELYPSLSLNGFLGFESLDSSKLLTRASRTYDIFPTLHWRLFEFGAVQREIDAQTATAKAVAAEYEQTVLGAMQEAEDTLTSVVQQQRQLGDLASAASASERALRLARALYDQGLASFQSVLDAQRNQLQSQDQLTTARAELTKQCIRLYRVLGGGVPPAAVPEARP